MSVAIRLARWGARKSPFYRVVVTDSRNARDGRYVEQIGTYDPRPETAKLRIAEKRFEEWVSKGARPSDTVRTLLKNGKVERVALDEATAAPEPAES